MRAFPRSDLPDKPEGYAWKVTGGLATFTLDTKPVQSVTALATADSIQFYPERSSGHRMIMNLLGVS